MFEHEAAPDKQDESKFDTLVERYCELRNTALQAAKHYDGAEETYAHLIAQLQAWEDFIRKQGFSGTIMEQETEAALQFTPDDPLDIEATIGVAVQSLKNRIQDTLQRKDQVFLYRRVQGIFLRPNAHDKGRAITAGPGTFEIRFDKIVEEFIQLLKEHDIFTDDIIVTECDPPEPDMIRQESYIKVEIPRLERTVLMCNQLEEGTYVIHGAIPDNILKDYGKRDLLSSQVFQARMVPRGSMWRDNMISLLTQEDPWGGKATGKREKYDVKEIMRIRNAFIDVVASRFTPEEWLDMEWNTFIDLRLIDGHTMYSLRTPLGMGDYIRYKECRILLGLWVWPDHEGLRQAYVQAREHYEDRLLRRDRTTDEWRALVHASITPEQWIALTPRQALRLTIPGTTAKLTAIGGAFGIRNVISNTKQRLLLGQALFPDSALIKNEINVENRTAAEWYDILRAQLTPDRFLKTKNGDELWKKRIDGRTLPAIAKVCGIKDEIHSHIIARLQFAAHIWPEDLQIHEALQNVAMDRDDWIHAIRETYTPEHWFTGSYLNLTVRKKKFGAIVRGIFEDSMRHNDAARLAIAKLVWPDDPIVHTATERSERTREGWISLIQERFTPTQWRELSTSKTDQIEIDGLGLTAIARKLGFPDFKFSSRSAHDKLGTMIWPDEYIPKERKE